MKMDGINEFTVFDDNNQEIECEVITTFYCEATNGHYVVFTSGDVDEEGDVVIEVSKYDPDSDELELLAIDDEQEQIIIEDTLSRILEVEMEENFDEEFEEEEE